MKNVNGLLILSLGLLSFSSFAAEPALPNGFIDTLNATYRTPSGSASATEVGISGFGEYKNPSMTLRNENGLLVFKFQENQFELDISMLGVTDAEKIDLSALNFHNDSENFFLSVEDVNARDTEFNTSLQSAFIDCKREKRYEDVADDLLSACLKNSEIKAVSGDFSSKTNSFYNVFDNETLGDEFTLSDLNIAVKNGKLKGSFKSNISKGVRVKLEADTSYNVESREVTVKITKAKASFLDIRKTIFKELGKLEVEGLRVEKPFIYFTID